MHKHVWHDESGRQGCLKNPGARKLVIVREWATEPKGCLLEASKRARERDWRRKMEVVRGRKNRNQSTKILGGWGHN